jgi:hypothetical protein
MSRTNLTEQAARQLPSRDFGIVVAVDGHRMNETHGLYEFCIRFYSGYRAWQLFPAVSKLDVVRDYVAAQSLDTRQRTPAQQFARLTGRTIPAGTSRPAPRRAAPPGAPVSSVVTAPSSGAPVSSVVTAPSSGAPVSSVVTAPSSGASVSSVVTAPSSGAPVSSVVTAPSSGAPASPVVTTPPSGAPAVASQTRNARGPLTATPAAASAPPPATPAAGSALSRRRSPRRPAR